MNNEQPPHVAGPGISECLRRLDSLPRSHAAASANGPAIPATPQQRPALKPKHAARLLRDHSLSVYLASGLDQDLAAILPVMGLQKYRDELIKDLGAGANRLATMIVEQMALSHHVLCRLQVRLARSKTAIEIRMISEAVTRIAGEFRRSTLVVDQLCQSNKAAPVSSKKGSGPESNQQPTVAAKKLARTKKASNTRRGTDVRPAHTVPFQKSPPRRRRAAKPA